MTYSEKIARQINTILAENGVRFQFDNNEGIFRMKFMLDKCRAKVYDLFITAKNSGIIFESIPSFSVSADDYSRMSKIAEYVCRINFLRCLGGFALDFNSGVIQYHSFMCCPGELVNREIFNEHMNLPDLLLDEYGNGFLSILYGNADPEKVFEQIQSNV